MAEINKINLREELTDLSNKYQLYEASRKKHILALEPLIYDNIVNILKNAALNISKREKQLSFGDIIYWDELLRGKFTELCKTEHPEIRSIEYIELHEYEEIFNNIILRLRVEKLDIEIVPNCTYLFIVRW